MSKRVLTYLMSLGLLLLWGSFSDVCGQEKRWSKEKLTWNDYKKMVNPSGIHHAFTYSGISFEMSSENDTVVIRVHSYFDPGQSWAHPDHRVPTLLRHEQLHFDITELFARLMKKEMSVYMSKPVSEFVPAKMDVAVKAIFTRLYNEHMLMQQKYDVETQHGVMSDEQSAWEKDISNRLLALSDFSTGL